MNKLLACSLLVLTVQHASASMTDYVVSNAGLPPSGFPSSIMVRMTPAGSGTPTPGTESGYQEADYVNAGLYNVPGFEPAQPYAGSLNIRVLDLQCKITGGAWLCDGYPINNILGRGEYIYIRPHGTVDAPQPVVEITPVPTPVVVDPVTPVKTVFHKRKPKPALMCTSAETKK